MREFFQAVALIVSFAATSLCAEAENPPILGQTSASDSYRQVLVKAVAFLDGPGAELEKDASCINCHHAPLRRWAMLEATRLGLQVDTQRLNETTDAELQSLSKRKDGYRGNQWGHSLSSFYVLGGLDDSLLAESSARDLTAMILAGQTADGSWKAAQQFANQRRPKHDANEAQTIWSVMALSELESQEGAVPARDKGLEWLRSAEPGTTIDSRALRLIVERRWGEPQRHEQLLKPFLESQHADGGWGWQSDDASDAWATGLALYALSEAGGRSSAGAVEAAQSFLAKSQREDGSWLVEGKLVQKPEMSSYFGTVWAIIGLSRTISTK